MGVNRLQVGIIGSSAGGHLAATVLAYHDRGQANASDPIDRVRYANSKRKCKDPNINIHPPNQFIKLAWHSSRPSFGVLVYPVIAMEQGDPIVHATSRLMLLGPNLTTAEDARLGWHYSIDKHVHPNRDFPPTFVFVPEDDMEVKPENSYRMAAALAAAKVMIDSDGI